MSNYNPDNYINHFRDGFIKALRSAAGQYRLDFGLLVEEVAILEQKLIDEHQSWVEDDAAKIHLAMTSLCLATYRIVKQHLAEDEALDVVRYAFHEPYRESVSAQTRTSLENTSDPLKHMAQIGQQKERYAYGKTFTFEVERNDEDAFFHNVHRCFYHRFFGANDAAELTPVFCEWDWLWAGEIVPEKHGVKFERPTTLGYGDDICRFQFSRVQLEID